MQKISEEKKTLNYDELMEIINSGYEPIGDLKQALEHPKMLKTYKELPVLINHDRKFVDTYLYYVERPYPYLAESNGISEAEWEARENFRETFLYKYQ